MNDDRFDQELRRLFDNFEEQYDPLSWEQLNSRIEKSDMSVSEADNEAFDRMIRKKLSDHTVAQEEESWQRMDEALTRSQERREKIIVSKVIEAAILLLLVLTFTKYKSLTTPSMEMDAHFFAEVQSSQKDSEAILAVSHLNIEDHRNAIIPIQPTDNANKWSVTFPVIRPHSISIPLTPLPMEPLLALNELDIPAIATLPIQNLVALPTLLEPPVSEVSYSSAIQSNPSDGWSVGIASSVDANFIDSKFDVKYLQSQIRSGLTGYSGGLSVNYRKGMIEVESGFRYSEKKYVPGKYTNYTKAGANSYLRSQLSDVRFQQVQIPLWLKVYAAPQKRFSFYALSGVAANILINTDFTLKKTIQSNARPSSLPHVKALDLLNPPKGFTEGGRLQDNLYLTAMMGIGIQYSLPNGVSGYLQPQYQHTISRGINEVAAEINTLGLEIGLKYRL